MLKITKAMVRTGKNKLDKNNKKVNIVQKGSERR